MEKSKHSQGEVLSFEAAVKELEKTVQSLEKAETPLEEQLQAFEKGVALSRDCMKKLDEVEKRVELLMKEASGNLSTQKFDAGS